MRQVFFLPVLGSLLCTTGHAQMQSQSSEANAANCEPSCCSWSCCCHPCLEYPVPLYEVYDNCGPGFGVRGDVLYMNYTIPTLSVAARVDVVGTHEDSRIISPTARPSLGCEVAASYRMCSDPGYTFESRWYHIVAQYGTNDSGTITPAHIVAITTGREGTVQNSAKIAINFFDLVLRKDYRWGQYLTFSPTVGVIGGYMHIKDSAHFTNTSGLAWGLGVTATDIQFNQNLKYEGIGARFGGAFEAEIVCGFKLMGNFYYNALYGFSKDTLDITSNGVIFGGLHSANAHYFGHHGRTFFDTLLGLSWETTFCSNSFWAELHAGWKVQYFPAGWTQFEAELNNALRELPLHGQGLQAGLSLKY